MLRNPIFDQAGFGIPDVATSLSKLSTKLVEARKKREHHKKYGITFINGYPDNTPKQLMSPKEFNNH